MSGPSFTDLLQGRAPKEAVDRLAAFGDLLERWAQRHNLVRVSDRQEMVDRHILESLAPIEHLNEKGRLVDI